MGTNKRIVVSSSGFPMTNKTLRTIQEMVDNPVTALALLAGSHVIMQGAQLVSGNYTPGWVAINGEILPFVGGMPEAYVTIEETIENAEYDYDGNSDSYLDIQPAYTTKVLKFGTGGTATYQWNTFVPLKTIEQITSFMAQPFVQDNAYIHTDNNFTNTLLTKLNGIAAGAEVNVQADWNAVNTSDDAYIKNKPVNVSRWLLTPRTVYIGDVYTDTIIPVTFPTVGNTDYIVVGHLVSYGTEWNYDNDVVWMVKDLTATGFKLLLKEVTGDTQQLRFKYGLLSI